MLFLKKKAHQLKNSRPHFQILRLSYFVFIILLAGIIFSSLYIKKVISDIPSIDKLDEYVPSLTTHIYDINGEVIADYSVEKRAMLTLDRIPVELQNALIAMEDRDFFNHWGISPKGILRALLRDLMHTKVAQGGSTITQQLSKLIFLKPERTIARKIKEIALSLQIERNFSKQEILQMYFNQIYLGSGVYGVQSASRIYFGKDVSALTLGECALLIGIIPSPERFSPFNNPQAAEKRKRLVLKSMFDEKYITKEEMEKALSEPLPTSRSNLALGIAPYFSEYIRQQLEPKYGVDMFWKGGLKVYTTLDLNMQKSAEEIMEKYLARYDEENKQNISSESISSTTLQGAFAAMEVKTGAIKVMIGGRDFKKSQFNRATQARRQAGSTFKPFVWMASLMNGYTPATLIYDNPMAFYFDSKDWRLFEDATDQYMISKAVEPFAGNPDFKIWVPNNFDGKFLGTITLRKALEKSRNLASIYLVTKIGATTVAETAYRAGIKSKLEAVPSIGLGTSLVTPMEMLGAFSTFANSGVHVEPFAVIRVEDSNGKILEQYAPKENDVFSPQYSYLLINMMKGVVQRGTGKAASRLKRPIAGKTGTSQDSKDTWFIGMTPDISAVAWMGYDDFLTIPMKDWTGGGTVVPWWTDIMEQILKNEPVRDFTVPEGIVFVNTDQESGKIALPGCKEKVMEAFVSGTEPKEFCDIKH
ncbi:MAG: PBP1A family penicillin-binding protein [Elusimicrobiota bacterium]